MNGMRLIRLRRVLLALSVVAAGWAVAVALTGGFGFRHGAFRISSRNPRNPLLLAMLGALASLGLSLLPGVRGTLLEEWSWWRRRLVAIVSVLRRHAWLGGVASATIAALLGAGLDIYQWAGAPSLWLDEEMIALNVRDRAFADLGGTLWLGQSAPLGWLAVQRAVLLTLGPGELASRLVAVCFGIATLVAAAWIGRRWMSRVGGVLLVALCSLGHWLSHYSFEMKHYSADTFWGLMLPGQAAWVTEAGQPRDHLRRSTIWWVAAAVGQWFSYGALLVAPACALLVFAVSWRRRGWRAAVVFALGGVIWLASFAAHYELSLEYTHHSEFLRPYWASQLPPASAGFIETCRWIVDRLEPLARNPAGTGLWVGLWLSAIWGFACRHRPILGAAFATAPLSAALFASVGLVPLHERFSLWVVPALYVGIVLATDWATSQVRRGVDRRQWTRLAPAVAVGLTAFYVSADIVRVGRGELDLARPITKHGLEDRAAIGWLMSHRRPGDAVMTTRLGWPAVWWYGRMSIADPEAVRRPQSDGTAMYEMTYIPPGSGCHDDRLEEVLKHHPRVLVYLGFRDVPADFETLLLRTLKSLGDISAYAEFSPLSLAAVVDLRSRVTVAGSAAPAATAAIGPSGLQGCVGVQPAHRW
jgi:hypothetical protein